jgi:hypothetical protein
VAETSGLLNRRTGFTRTEGSNPSVSAKTELHFLRLCAPSGSAGPAPATDGCALVRLFEDLLDPALEQFGNPEGQRKRRIVPSGFYGMNALAGNAELFTQLGLGPSALLSQFPKPVLHSPTLRYATRGQPLGNDRTTL